LVQSGVSEIPKAHINKRWRYSCKGWGLRRRGTAAKAGGCDDEVGNLVGGSGDDEVGNLVGGSGDEVGLQGTAGDGGRKEGGDASDGGGRERKEM
jgi:hypothetical protein